MSVVAGRTAAQTAHAIATWRGERPGAPVLALEPTHGATHYQAHSGVIADTYEAEHRTFRSSLRRTLAPVGLAVNLARQRRLRAERALCSDPATRIMTFSHRDAASLRQRFGVTSAQLTTAHPGINLQRFLPVDRPRAGGPIHALFAGHNFRLKGLDVTLQALARVHREIHLTVAGGDRTAPWIRRAHRLGLGTQVQFVGAVDSRSMVQLYQQSDVLIHPAAYDPFPRVIPEALACGCPVITTPSCGGAEILRTGHDGWVVDASDMVAQIAAVLTTLRSSSRGDSVARNAVTTGRQFDFEVHVTDVLAWLLQS
jgi:UDP-glucose:(heptosyl)LPS alpha-1,3-glucosyltransferase